MIEYTGCMPYHGDMPKRTAAMLSAALAAPHPLTLPQLQAALANASPSTTFRYLRQIPYLRSYNHNGRFYTRADPQRFDRFGLLSLGTARFSCERSLAATVARLVDEAETGWTAKELDSLLHVSARPFLLSAVRSGHIQREPMHGVFLYLATDAVVADRQRAARRHRMPRTTDLDPSLVIEVLLALIRHPRATPVQLARYLRGHAPPIELPDIIAVFTRFDLEQVAKKGGPADC